MAVVVAHLDGLVETAPLAPVEHGVELLRRVARLEAKERAIVLLRRPHDLAGIHEALRIEEILDLLESARELRAEERRDPFRAHEPVAVLARVRAFVFLHELRRLFGDRAHFVRAVFAHVEYGPHVQAADRRVRVPRAARAVLFEHARQPVGVLGEVLERHRAVFDEGHRLAVAFHRHHDVEPRFAHFPHVALQARVGDLDHAAGEAEIGHELGELLSASRAARRGPRPRTRPAGSPPARRG